MIPAGPERDDYIAEHFMGWKRWDTWRDARHKIPVVLFSRPDRTFQVEAPKWSTEDAEALELAKELRRKGWYVNFDLFPESYEPPHFACMAMHTETHVIKFAEGDTLADAVTQVVVQIAVQEEAR